MLRPETTSESRRLLVKLVRELARSELQAIEHATREARRIGDAPPTHALHDISVHAAEMRERLVRVLEIHEVSVGKTKLGATLASLCNLVVDRMIDADRAYRMALYDLRHGIELVELLRNVARAEPLFALIRWCDDWRRVRGTLVARAEAELAWFNEAARAAPTPATSPLTGEDLEVLPKPSPRGDRTTHLELV